MGLWKLPVPFLAQGRLSCGSCGQAPCDRERTFPCLGLRKLPSWLQHVRMLFQRKSTDPVSELRSWLQHVFSCSHQEIVPMVLVLAGYGQPHAWTVKGLAAAFNPDLPFPQWVDRTASTVVPIGTQSTCSYQMVWYSAFACPVCTKDDYEAVEVSGCVNNTYITYKYKQPQVCRVFSGVTLLLVRFGASCAWCTAMVDGRCTLREHAAGRACSQRLLHLSWS